MSAFQTVIEKYRKMSYSQKDKGFHFELLMQRFLTSDPKYSGTSSLEKNFYGKDNCMGW